MYYGLFTDKQGTAHSFYEIETNQYHRLDICKYGTPFQTDPSGVEYSIINTKKILVYGNPSIYDDFMDLKTDIHHIKGTTTKESRWDEGKFYVVTVKTNPSKDFEARTAIINGTINNFEARYGERLYQYVASDAGYSKMDPLNISEYKEKVISLESSDDSSYTTPYYPYEVLIRRYDLKHLDSKDLVVADTDEIAEQRLKEWCESTEDLLGFDTETTGLDVWKYGDDMMVGIILSEGETKSTYFPFRMKTFHNQSKKFLDKLMRAAIERQERLVAHNKRFDRQVMFKEGYDIRIKWCTNVLDFMLNPRIEKGLHALKEIMLTIDGNKYLELSEIFISKSNIDFSILPANIVKIYACTDSTSAVTVLKDRMPKVPLDMWPIILIEMKLADLKADQEYFGMRIDVYKYMKNFRNNEYVLNLLLTTFRKMTHEDGNIDSREVLSTLLYDKMGCKVLMRTTTGMRSTSGKAIDKLAGMKASSPHNITEDIVDLNGKVVISADKLANSKYPALVILSKYREFYKRKTAFYARFERTVKVGRISFWINQNGASSGRQSSPMHQLPPELKDVILSDSDSKDLWGPDFSQIELRMIAFLAGEKDLIEMCTDPENDVHRVCASLITGKEMWEITPEERSIKKRVNFGVVYLISGYGLAGQLKGPGYTKEDVEFCQEQLDAFYKRFKRIDLYLKKNAIKVKTNGYMKTYFNRIKYFKEIFDPDITNKKRASIIRQSNNMPVQGTAADVMKIAEVNMDEYIRERGWNELDKDGFPKVRVMLSIHDEALISASQDIPMEEIIQMIRVCMQIDIDGAPPFFVSPAKMMNWGGHSDDSLSIPVKYRDELIVNYNKTHQTVFKRSYYEVSLEQSMRDALEKETGDVKLIVNKYMQYATFKYLRGDYTTELSEDSKKDALRGFIESGRTIYVDENYKLLLDSYRKGVLHDYMTGLIREYKTAEEVGLHVRHPSLTHQLLDVYSKQLKGLDMTQVEKISYATKLYMEETPTETEDVLRVHSTDKDVLFEQAETLYSFDKDGNLVFENGENDNEDDYYVDDTDEQYILKITEGKIYKAWRLVENIIVDVDSLDMDGVNKVLAYLWEFRDKDGFYKVMLSMSGNLIDTKFRVEDLDIAAVTEFIVNLEKGVCA